VTGTYASVGNTITIFAENKMLLLIAYIFSETVIKCTDVAELGGYLWNLFAALRTMRGSILIDGRLQMYSGNMEFMMSVSK
jgi:hypothetical protein